MSIKTLSWLSAIVVINAILLAMLDLSEFYNVAIEKHTAYPFGGINDTPWYYRSEKTYSLYMLISGFMLLALSGNVIYFCIKRNFRAIAISISLLSLLLVATLISGVLQ